MASLLIAVTFLEKYLSPRIPLATKAILDVCKDIGTPCFVATNILDSMMTNDLPSRARFPIYSIYLFLDHPVLFWLLRLPLVKIQYQVLRL